MTGEPNTNSGAESIVHNSTAPRSILLQEDKNGSIQSTLGGSVVHEDFDEAVVGKEDDQGRIGSDKSGVAYGQGITAIDVEVGTIQEEAECATIHPRRFATNS